MSSRSLTLPLRLTWPGSVARSLRIAVLGLVAASFLSVTAPAPASAASLYDQCIAQVGGQKAYLDGPNSWVWAPRTTLSVGSSGVCVRYAQSQLLLWGLGSDLAPYGVDGKFGPHTRKATMHFQRQRYPYVGPVDGIIGVRTWSELVFSPD